MCVCVCVCVRTCMCCDSGFCWSYSILSGTQLLLLSMGFTHIAPIVQWGPSNTWKVDTKRCISHIMWHVQPSFELMVLSLTVFLRCALLGKHDCVTRLLQAFVNTCVCVHCVYVYLCAAGKVPGSILLICSHC